MNVKNLYIFSLMLFAVIFFLIIAISLQLFTNMFSPDFIPGDTYTYIKAAKHLYVDTKFSPVRPYGYSLIVGIPFLFDPEANQQTLLIWSFIINFILWILTIFYLYKAVQLLTGKKYAFFASMIFVLCVAHIAQVVALMTETLASFLITVFGYLVLKFQLGRNYKYLSSAIGISILLILIRPGMLYLALLFIAIFIIILVANKIKFSSKLYIPIIIPLGLLMVQIFSNYKGYGNFTNSYTDKYTWYTYLGAESHAESQNKTFLEVRDARRKIINPMSPTEYFALAKNDFHQQAEIHPGLILKHYLLNIKDNIIVGNIRISGSDDFNDTRYFNYIRYYLYLISKFQNVLISILGLLLSVLFLKARSILLLFGSLMVGYIIFTSGITFWEGDRFNTVFYPLVIILVTFTAIEFKKSRLKLE